jgi:hypothetical protein
MKRVTATRASDDLRAEYDLTQLKGGVRGKYYERATAGTNLVLIEPDLHEAFPDAASVNRALRVLVEAAAATAVSAKKRKAPHRAIARG